MRDRVTINLKPTRASADVPPPLSNNALGVSAVVKIVSPGLIVFGFGISRPLAFRFSRADKLAFVSWSTPRTGNFQHYTIPING